jgi:tRNA-Thr(GGU) m(6)t(6)A37 methyltransferase TsaA
MKHLILATAMAVAATPLSAMADDAQSTTKMEFKMRPIGHVEKSEDRTLIVLDKKYEPGLLGLDGFSHVYVFWWFSLNDSAEKRATLQVHPMGNRENPLTGVFATRSPRRPNLVALTLCKIVSVKENVVEVEKIDAFDGTPVIDIKPFIPGYDSTEDGRVPGWLDKGLKKRREQAKLQTGGR